MKEYYFLIGKDQNGPFSIEELKSKGLSSETMIWTEGMENWQKLKDVPELFQQLNIKTTPPPPPPDIVTIQEIKPSRRPLTILIIWCSFHLLALLMSYTEISFFNEYELYSEPKEKFWPFVKILQEYSYYGRPGTEYTEFNGIFYKYDWTEFAAYIGGALIIFLLYSISRKNQEPIIKKTSKYYVVKKMLATGQTMEIIRSINSYGDIGSEVRIDGKAPDNCIVKLKEGEWRYEINNGKVSIEYYILEFKQKDGTFLEIDCDNRASYQLQKGSRAWINNNPAPDGIYKAGFWRKVKVKDGFII